MSDDGTRATNNDAASCKRWCVERGYFSDPYIKYFVPLARPKTPEISRGYYYRVQCIRQVVREFIRAHAQSCQIINIGAGSDTLFWNLCDEGLQPAKFIELDFAQIVMKKYRTINKHPEMAGKISPDKVPPVNGNLHSPKYHLISIDLRDRKKLDELVVCCELETALPTLVLAECVLCYVPPDTSNSLITWVAATFPNSMFLNYEPCCMNDRFGTIMVENMRTRDCELPGILACVTLRDQETRYLDAHFTSAKALDMERVMCLLPLEDRERINKIEMFDEIELLTQLLQHYCLSWGCKGAVKPPVMFEEDASHS